MAPAPRIVEMDTAAHTSAFPSFSDSVSAGTGAIVVCVESGRPALLSAWATMRSNLLTSRTASSMEVGPTASTSAGGPCGGGAATAKGGAAATGTGPAGGQACGGGSGWLPGQPAGGPSGPGWLGCCHQFGCSALLDKVARLLAPRGSRRTAAARPLGRSTEASTAPPGEIDAAKCSPPCEVPTIPPPAAVILEGSTVAQGCMRRAKAGQTSSVSVHFICGLGEDASGRVVNVDPRFGRLDLSVAA
mmetsp:Transcript_21109/g.58499  ORF Transcript_21109/g.58499 Transcript_21109/m.58499 type:complete len:246 (-) Transcript_21109:7-744(-)